MTPFQLIPGTCEVGSDTILYYVFMIVWSIIQIHIIVIFTFTNELCSIIVLFSNGFLRCSLSDIHIDVAKIVCYYLSLWALYLVVVVFVKPMLYFVKVSKLQ